MDKRKLPSKREKRRYLAFEIISDDRITCSSIKSIESAIKAGFIERYGADEASRAHLRLITERFSSDRGIIRINNKYLNKLKDTLPSIRKADDKKLEIKGLGVSGILKKAFQKYVAS